MALMVEVGTGIIIVLVLDRLRISPITAGVLIPQAMTDNSLYASSLLYIAFSGIVWCDDWGPLGPPCEGLGGH